MHWAKEKSEAEKLLNRSDLFTSKRKRTALRKVFSSLKKARFWTEYEHTQNYDIRYLLFSSKIERFILFGFMDSFYKLKNISDLALDALCTSENNWKLLRWFIVLIW